jgi:hypothetical protein
VRSRSRTPPPPYEARGSWALSSGARLGWIGTWSSV